LDAMDVFTTFARIEKGADLAIRAP
jgi:hypothetical protein